MPTIPALTATQVIRALKKKGFIKDRQKGGHLVLIQPTTKARTVIPIHAGRTIKKSLLRAVINDAKLSVEEFLELI